MRAIHFLALFLLIISCAACTQREPKEVPVPYAVPTYLPCKLSDKVKVDEKGNVKRPVWPDNDNAMNGVLPNGVVMVIGIDGQVEMLFEGRTARDEYIDVVETALNGCTH